MRLRAFFLALLFIAVVLPLPTHGDSDECSATLPSRVAVGFTARVAFNNPAAALLHEDPGDTYRRSATLPHGAALKIVGGPTCADNMAWWQARTLDGQSGWISEADTSRYAIEPWPISLDVVRPDAKSYTLVRVNAVDGAASMVSTFPADSPTDADSMIIPAPDSRDLLLLSPREVSIQASDARTTILTIPANAAPSSYHHIDGAWWSPDGERVLVLAQYSAVGHKLLVYDRHTAGLFDLGDGLNPAWDESGQRVQWIRSSASQPNAPQTLISANVDDTDEQTISLPAGIDFTAAGLPWNAAGALLLGCAKQGKAGCTKIAAFDVRQRRGVASSALDPALQAAGYRLVRWLDDSRLIWLPANPKLATLYVQNISTGETKTLRLKDTNSTPFSITTVAPFVDGSSLLVTLSDARGAQTTLIVQAETGQITPVKMPA